MMNGVRHQAGDECYIARGSNSGGKDLYLYDNPSDHLEERLPYRM
jgi:hypothetical protein